MSQPFAGNVLTSDPRRYAAFNALAVAAPDYVIGAPTLGWLHAAFRTMDWLAQSDVLQRITIPVLAVAGRIDLGPDELAGAGIVGTAALLDLEPDLGRAQEHAAELVTRSVDQLLR